MELQLFYNPIWMPSEETIRIWCFEIPKQVIIKNYEEFELYVRDYYKYLCKKSYEEHGVKVYKWYHEFIDENVWYNDPNGLIDCLMESNKFAIQALNLKERINDGIMPEDIIGHKDAQDIFEDMDLYELFYSIDYLSD